jgi:hypothetical protein
MEPLWSPVVATGGNRRQIEESPRAQKQAKTVATGCHPLPEKFHGKEGVSGSSPGEGSEKAPEIGAFSFRSTCSDSNVRWVWSPGWSLQVEHGLLKPRLSLMNELVDLINDECSAAFGAPAIGRRRQFAGARWPSQTAGFGSCMILHKT